MFSVRQTVILGSALALSACGSVDGNADSDDPTIDAAPADGPVAGGPFAVISEPRSDRPIGYVGPDGRPAAIVFSNGGRPAQCRSAHVSALAGTSFQPCPDPAANGRVTFEIQPSVGKTDGTYRAEVEYEDDAGATQTHSIDLYMHRTLDGVAECADEADWPSDAAFFAAATSSFTFPTQAVYAGSDFPAWATPAGDPRTGTMPATTTFGASDLQGPRFVLHFTNAAVREQKRYGTFDGDDFPTMVTLAPGTATFDLPVMSLRHRIVANPDNTLILIHRQYESRTVRAQNDVQQCRMGTRFGAYHSVVGRASRTWQQSYPCDAYVLNAAGEGFCMVVDDAGEPVKAVFSRQMHGKLMAENFTNSPKHFTDSVWGPKVYDDDWTYADSLSSVPYAQVKAEPVIIRP
jgi:hypothetical protein